MINVELQCIWHQKYYYQILGFVHPRTGEQMDFSSPLPDDMGALIEKWRNRLKTQELKEII